MKTAESYIKRAVGMARKNPSIELLPPFLNLKERLVGFKDSLPLM
jgi:hypothetical protein